MRVGLRALLGEGGAGTFSLSLSVALSLSLSLWLSLSLSLSRYLSLALSAGAQEFSKVESFGCKNLAMNSLFDSLGLMASKPTLNPQSINPKA